MSAAGWSLQKAIVDALAADAAVTALLGDPPRLHDGPPRAGVYPYAAFGDARETPLPGDLVEHDLRIQIHARYEGRRDVAEIETAIVAALESASLVIDGRRLVSLRATATDIFHRPETDAHQGVIRLRAVTEAVE